MGGLSTSCSFGVTQQCHCLTCQWWAPGLAGSAATRQARGGGVGPRVTALLTDVARCFALFLQQMCLVFLALGGCCLGVQQNVCISPREAGCCRAWSWVRERGHHRSLLVGTGTEQAGDRRWAEVRKGQGSVPLAAAGCSSNLSPTGRHSVPCPLDVREKMLLQSKCFYL